MMWGSYQLRRRFCCIVVLFSSSVLLPIYGLAPLSLQTLSRAQKTQSNPSRLILSMKVPVLEEWKVLTNGRVMGTVKYHPSIPDGDTITTSAISEPALASKNKIVVTTSGSKYKLGMPQMSEKNGKVSIKELQQRAKKAKQLTGEVVGEGNHLYLLSGKPTMSTSGKSRIYKAYRATEDFLPTGESVTVKLTKNWEALDREARNYNRVTQSGIARGKFVDFFRFFPSASDVTKSLKALSALVLERGSVDLKRYVAMNGPLKGTELREAAATAAQCIQGVHSSGMVWTDLKTENFVVMDDGTVRGIDLESAMPVKDNPVDYSPEATPPEFAEAFLSGDGPYFVLDYNYDIWSFGMLLYELATGKGYFDGKTPVQITKELRTGPTIDLSAVEDKKLSDLIGRCLRLDPDSRPNIFQVLLHPYFLSTGIGPLNF